MSRSNFVQCQLAAPVLAGDTAITIKVGAAFAPPPADGGILVITDSLGLPTAFEVIKYTSRGPLNGGVYQLSGVTRGLEGTTARAWAIDHFIYQSLTVGDLDAIISSLQTQINGKQATLTGAATSIASSNLPASMALVSDTSGKVAAHSTVSATELGYLDGVTSAIQTQLNAKAPLNSPALTGTPTAPTAAVGTNTTQVATTAFVQAEIANDAPTKTGTGASGTWGISVTGNAATATKLATARSITLSGDVTGSASFDGSANVSITATVADDSHNHTIANVDGLQTALDGKANVSHTHSYLPLSGGTLTGNVLIKTGGWSYVSLQGAYGDRVSLHAGGESGRNEFRIGAYSRVDGSFIRNPFVFDLTTGTLTAAQFAGNAATASKLQTARTITLSGDVTGSASFDGSANVTITATVGDNSHNHTISNVGGLQAALDSKANVSHTHSYLPLSGGTMTGAVLFGNNGSGNGIQAGNGDNATSTINNLKLTSWYGIGFGPSISGQSVPLGQYSHWMNVRNGDMGIRGSFTASGNVTAYSDIRLKTDIQVIPDALAKVEQLRGVTYTRIETGERQTGVIAQEVQEVLPEAVRDDGEHLSVAYGNMVGLLIEAVKELSEKVRVLEVKLNGAA